MSKILSLIIAVILVAFFQLGFLPGLSYNLTPLINLPLLFIVFVAFFYNAETAIITALFLGLLLDLYSTLFFGFHIILLLIEVLAIKFFILHILQNKNLVVFLLVNSLAVLIWQVIYLAVIIFQTDLTNQYFINILGQLLIHSVLILTFYKILPNFKFKLASQLVG